MITTFSPTPYWVPPPQSQKRENLRIITDYPPLMPVPAGIKPAWWPINAAQQAVINSPAEMLLAGGSSGFGKRLDLDTPLATMGGWTTMRDVRVGDVLFDECGSGARVTAISEIVIGDAYRITFDDGTEIVADDDHEWHTVTGRERQKAAHLTDEWRAKRRAARPSRAKKNPTMPWAQKMLAERNSARVYEYKAPPSGSIKTTREIRETLIGVRGENNHSIAVAGVLQYESKALPIDPYVFGCWLGDGTSSGGGFTCNDPQIVEEIRRSTRPVQAIIPEGFCQCGCGTKTSVATRNNLEKDHVIGRHVRFAVGHGSRSDRNLGLTYEVTESETDAMHYHIRGITQTLNLLGVIHNKHIPRLFLEASPEQRIDLIRGLMDTDGTCSKKGHCSFTNTRLPLIDGFLELALSLGIKATVGEGIAKIKGRPIGPKWTVKFTAPFPVFRLKRKLDRQQKSPRLTTRNRYVVAVEKVLDRPMRCIAVDSPSHLYLAGKNLVPTHNSAVLVGDAMQEYWLPSFRGLLLRESLGEMDQLEDSMRVAYEPLGAVYRRRTGGGEWEFPLFDERTRRPVRRKGGARIRFGYLSQDKDLGRYRGNPKSWIGIDESGLHPEKRVRTMIPWLAAVDRRLRVRARFASNPGGVGATWQMAVFLRNRCPLHYPAGPLDLSPSLTSVVPGKVYSGASWKWPPSPSELVHMTTAFFPASVFDNPLYDQSKIDKLRSQTPELQLQLLYGCWCNAESLYFGFMRPEMMIPVQLIPDEWWWNHAISIDYGYGNSAAAAGRYSIDENGRAFGTGEIIEKKMGARDFARKVAEQWIKPKGDEHAQRVLFVCMDPAMDQHHDIGKSNFEIMAEVFAEYGVPSVRSHKAPADNAQNLYTGLADQTLIITSAMPQTFNAISTRVIDERKAVKKIHGDPLDDLYDQTAYFWNTWIIESVKPERLKLQESLAKMREHGADATSIARRSMMETRRIEEAERQRSRGLPLRGGRR